MITIEKLKTWEKYRGSDDAYVYLIKKGEISTNRDFLDIRNAVQDSRLIQKNQASAEYTTEANKRIAELCDSQETVDYLNSLAARTDY